LIASHDSRLIIHSAFVGWYTLVCIPTNPSKSHICQHAKTEHESTGKQGFEKSAGNTCNEQLLILFDNIPSIGGNNSKQSLMHNKYSE
jgi:hypothetical protein